MPGAVAAVKEGLIKAKKLQDTINEEIKKTEEGYFELRQEKIEEIKDEQEEKVKDELEKLQNAENMSDPSSLNLSLTELIKVVLDTGKEKDTNAALSLKVPLFLYR